MIKSEFTNCIPPRKLFTVTKHYRRLGKNWLGETVGLFSFIFVSDFSVGKGMKMDKCIWDLVFKLLLINVLCTPQALISTQQESPLHT